MSHPRPASFQTPETPPALPAPSISIHSTLVRLDLGVALENAEAGLAILGDPETPPAGLEVAYAARLLRTAATRAREAAGRAERLAATIDPAGTPRK